MNKGTLVLCMLNLLSLNSACVSLRNTPPDPLRAEWILDSAPSRDKQTVLAVLDQHIGEYVAFGPVILSSTGPNCYFQISEDISVYAQFLEFPKLSFSHWRNLLGVEGVLEKRNEEYLLRSASVFVIHDQ